MNNFLDGKNNKQQYEIVERIGSGGFGEVYKAKDKTNNRIVAVKVFQRQLGQDNSAYVDWEREAEHALTLKSDHVIESFEFAKPADDTGDYYLVMQFADNGNLRKLIDEQKQKKELLQELMLLDIFKQTLLGLQTVHQSALHRDIKPENMLFVGDVLKLSDFGLAKHIDQATRTRTYKGWGTYIYMAPESWSLGKMIPATDIYSLGIVFYELVTLQLPFSSADVIELENLHKYGDRPRARSVNPQISTKLDGIIYKMMMQSASSRYQSADEILQELDREPTGVPLSSSLQNAATLAQQLHIKKTQEEAAQQKRHDQEIERTKMNKVKISEFIGLLEQSVESFNHPSLNPSRA
ncbi:MAG: protein kinase [Patescibacteria group bacterium]